MSEEAKTYEHHFITKDKNEAGHMLTFNMIEDESGDVFWAYHHVEPREFIEEVNRWLKNCAVPEEQLIQPLIDGPAVKHLWARMIDDERFKICQWEAGGHIFPVTRLMT